MCETWSWLARISVKAVEAVMVGFVIGTGVANDVGSVAVAVAVAVVVVGRKVKPPALILIFLLIKRR
jgi:hypothetical protein